MTDKEYFETLDKDYIKALLKLNADDKEAFCKRWNKKPATLMNDITLLRKAIEEKWLCWMQ